MCHLGNGGGKNGSKTKVEGNNTLKGQIATFMDTLHLTYHEVVCEIPYPSLLIMQVDKLHIADDKIDTVEMSGKDMLRKKRDL